MNKLYLLGVALIFSYGLNGQIVNIPDPAFKNYLIQVPCVSQSETGDNWIDADLNDNGEIEVSEALTVKRMLLNFVSIQSLEGLNAFANLVDFTAADIPVLNYQIVGFANLKYVSISNIQMQQLELSNLPSLIYLSVSNNFMTSLDLSGVPSLETLTLYNTDITNLSVAGLPQLRRLTCTDGMLESIEFDNNLALEELVLENNHLTELNTSEIPNVILIDVANNQLTELSLSGLDQLLELYIPYNQLTELVIPETSQIFVYDISGNLYTTVDFPNYMIGGLKCENSKLITLDIPPFAPAAAEYVYITDNADLQFLSLKNGAMDLTDEFPNPILWYISITGNPQLHHICWDDNELPMLSQGLLDELASTNNPNLAFSSYCSFTPGGQFNQITGDIALDCDGLNIPMDRLQISVSGPVGSSGITFSDNNGDFVFFGGIGNFTVTPNFGNTYFSVNPASAMLNFTELGISQNADFCIAPNGVHPDLQMAIFEMLPAVPGFNATYKLVIENVGTETQSGVATFNFDGAKMDFVSSTIPTLTEESDQVSFNFTDLQPFQSTEIDIMLNINTPMETPPVSNGDILVFSASAGSALADETPDDNSAELFQTVIGSYDPNDKAVSEGSQILIENTDDYLHYLVRFQNTGTAPAVNVVVKDMLEPTLDPSTIQIVSASHPMRPTLTQGNKLEFFFENIQLPAESVDEPGSHGYIAFKIKPASSIGLGTVIENTAEIYFDFNFPIITNTVTTTVVPELSIGENHQTNIIIHPNPASDHFTILGIDEHSAVEIYNQLGQIVKSESNNHSNERIINISELPSGTYFVKICSGSGTATAKLIKS